MTKRAKSKHKVDRRLKVNLWGRPKSPFNTRAYSPGQHGQNKKSKPTDYGVQLIAKQKLKSYYGNINERQFRNIYRKAIKKKGDTTENLVALLEKKSFFKNKEKQQAMLLNIKNLFYRMELSDKETRILASIISALNKSQNKA